MAKGEQKSNKEKKKPKQDKAKGADPKSLMSKGLEGAGKAKG